MPELTSDDIALGRLALTRGVVTRPQLDAAVALVRGGQAADLARALLRTGGLAVRQLEQLRAQAGGAQRPQNGNSGPPLPLPPAIPPGGRAVPKSEALTMQDDGEITVGAGMDRPADLSGSHRGPGGFAPPTGTGFGPAPTGFGPPPNGGFGPAPPGFGPAPTGFGPPPNGGFGSPPSAFNPPGGGGFGAPGGGFGPPPGDGGFGAPAGGFGGDFPASAGFGAPPPSTFGPGNFGAPPSGVGAPGGGFGGPGGGFGDPPSGGFGGGATGYDVVSGSGGDAGALPTFGGTAGAGGGAVQEKVGPWVIEREIARGGMGAIYLGKHETTGERAAVKVMLIGDAGASEKKVKRFLREIDANKKLVHPGIVRILDAGEWSGYPYFAMEFVEGKPLDRMLKDDLDLEIGMEILEAVARAVHYAHEQGIIHRDLKPANIIVQDDMLPKLTDFGLAKNSDNQSVLTKTGAVIGTPYYLSPEQAAGRSKDIDARADIYALGVMMYELATGRLPFVGQTTVELYNRIIHDEPVPPSKVKPQLTKAFETVCLKGMAKHAEDRYPTAAAMADDIQALLQGGTVAAKTDNAAARAIKKFRRKGSVPLVLGSMGLALLLSVGGIVWHFKRVEWRRQQQRVDEELADFEKRLEERLQTATTCVTQGSNDLLAERVPDALATAARAVEALEAIDKCLDEVKLEPNQAVAKEKVDAQKERLTVARAGALVLRARATMLSNEGDALTKAAEDLKKVLDEVRPDDVGAQLAQGDLHVHSGKLNEALEQYRHALERAPDALRAQLGRARALFLLESYADAIPVLTQALERLGRPDAVDPEAGDAELLELRLLVQRARTFLEMGELEKARQDALAAGQSPKADWTAKAMLGEVLMRAGDRFAARDAFADAIAAAPEDQPGPQIALAEALIGAGAYADALEDARKAVEKDPSSLLALVVKAEAEEALLHLKDALRDAEAVTLRTHARDWRLAARAERVWARVLATNGTTVAEAHKHARSANTLDEHSSVGRLLRGTIELDPSFDEQHLESADNLFKLVLRQRPRSLEAKRGIGLVALIKNARAPERAQNKLEDALQEDPRDPWTLAALAKVFEDRNLGDKARRHRQKQARSERDVRRREGFYFALGLREQKRSRLVTGQKQAEHIELARDAYRRALWLDPLHTQALTGLASITHLQGSRDTTEKLLTRARSFNATSTQVLVLNAMHLASRNMRDTDPNKGLEAITKALAERGETLELLALRALLTVREQPKPGESLSLGQKIDGALQQFEKLRQRNPWSLSDIDLEREMIEAALRGLPAGDPTRDRLEKRHDELRRLHTALGQDMDERERASEELRLEAEKLLNSGDGAGAAVAAKEATRKAPWRADAWAVLARARARKGEVWDALAAAIRAAHTDDQYAVKLFELLRSASRASEGDLAAVAERMVAIDNVALPFEPDLEVQLRAAPLVARALVAKPDAEVGKKTAEQLETLVNHDPTLIAPQVLLGVLTYGADEDELAIQHLLFVGMVCDAGEAYYLAAVVLASQKNATLADRVQAVEWLQQSTFAGFDWVDRARKEPRLEALRESPLWSRLPEAEGK